MTCARVALANQNALLLYGSKVAPNCSWNY